MGENICKECDWQGINHQNTQTACTAQYEKKNPNQKMGRSKQTVLQRHSDGQQAHEKMLTIANY